MESTDNGNPSGCHDSHSEGSVDGDTADASKSKSMVPPYWSHRRYESYASVENTRPPPITLEDHTEGFSEQSDSVWAKRVLIEDYVLVAGSVPNVGKFVVYTCKIETLDVSLFFNIRSESALHLIAVARLTSQNFRVYP